MSKHLKPADYLKKILNARVYDVATESGLEIAKNLSERLHNKVLLKREDQQPVHSFKLRGAYNKMAHLTPEQLKKGVICASAGNHAQGVALGAKRLGTKAIIVMPTTTPSVKIEAVKALGGEVVLAGDSYSDAYTHALTLEKKNGMTFVHPFDDPDVIAGQGTVAMDQEERTMWIFEPSVAEKVFEDYVKEFAIPVLRDEWLDRAKGVRLADGREAVLGLVAMKDALEDPSRLLFDI